MFDSSSPFLPSGPHRDLRWWHLVLSFFLVICTIFLAFGKGDVFVELIKAIALAAGGVGLKALWDKT